MKTIQLTRNSETMVSDEDYEYLSQWKWFAHSKKGLYAVRGIYLTNGRKNLFMHNVIAERMGLAIVGKKIDHIDLNTLNNQRENLRVATHSQNMMNRNMFSRNTSGYKGVIWETGANKWRARIRVNTKLIHLGLFTSPEDAALAYDIAAIKHHGDFAKLNFPQSI